MSELVTQIDFSDRDAGDIICLHGAGLISDSIMLGEKIAREVQDKLEFSHIAIAALKPSDKRPGYTLEAIWPRIAMSPWDVYAGQVTACFRINVDLAVKLSALLQIEHEYVGKRYNLESVVALGGIEILRHFNIEPKKNPIDPRQKQFCSEMGTRFIEMLVPSDHSVPAVTDPQQVYNFLRDLAKPSAVQIVAAATAAPIELPANAAVHS